MFFGSRCQENSCNSLIDPASNYITCISAVLVDQLSSNLLHLLKNIIPHKTNAHLGANKVNCRSFLGQKLEVTVSAIKFDISEYKFLLLNFFH